MSGTDWGTAELVSKRPLLQVSGPLVPYLDRHGNSPRDIFNRKRVSALLRAGTIRLVDEWTLRLRVENKAGGRVESTYWVQHIEKT
jgi:hypothetical protein